MNKNNNVILKKHTSAIHCTNAQSLLQRKVSNALLFNAYNDLLVKEEHEITITHLCKLIGYIGHNHAAIKGSLKELITTLLEWNLIDEDTGEEEWNACSMLASVRLRGSLCIYSYSPNLRRLLHNPSIYGKINLIVQSHFRSSYGLALYENCIRYYGLPSTRWFEIDIFRKLMGVPENKYEIFRDFKRRVLDKAVEEVNTYSDLYIKYEIARAGKKVTKIKFSLKDRPKKTALGIDSPMMQDLENIAPKIAISLQQYGISDNVSTNLVKKYGEEYIREKVTLVEDALAKKRGKIHDIAGYLMGAIQNDYKLPTANNVNMNVDSLKSKEIIINEKEDVRKKYQAYIIDATMEAFYNIPEEQQQLIEQAFENVLSKNIMYTPILESFKTYRFNSEFNCQQFVEFIGVHYSYLQDQNMTWDAFYVKFKPRFCS